MSARPVGHLDKQLEGLLARLRAAEGDPVSFEDLRAEGIENPALLCYELEVAGVPLERVHRDGGAAASPVAVQLDESGLRQHTQPMPAAELPDATGQRLRAGIERTRLLLADTRDEAAELAARAAGAARTLAGEPHTDVSPRQPRTNGAGRPPRPPAPAAPAGGRGVAARRRFANGRVGALAALVLACATVLAVVLANLSGSSGGKPNAGAGHLRTHRARAETLQASATGRSPQSGGATTSSASAPPAPSQKASATPPAGGGPSPTQAPAQAAPSTSEAAAASPQAAASMQAQGHQLLGEGRYPQAINQLRAAAAASGGSLARCAEPSGTACLTYAYALYDLGRALRLDGQTASALAVLGERLQIDNQRPVVEEEIALARGAGADTGAGPAAETPAAAPPQGPARRRAHDGARRRGHARSPLTRSGGIAAAG